MKKLEEIYTKHSEFIWMVVTVACAALVGVLGSSLAAPL